MNDSDSALVRDALLRPSVLFRPELRKAQMQSPEGKDYVMWLAVYGDFTGFCDSPEGAMADFDKKWKAHIS